MTPGVAIALARMVKAANKRAAARSARKSSALPKVPRQGTGRFFNRSVNNSGGGAPIRLIRTRTRSEKTLRQKPKIQLDPDKDVIVRFDAEGIRGQAYYDQEIGMTYADFIANRGDLTGFAQSQWNPPTTDPVARGSIRITKVYQD